MNRRKTLAEAVAEVQRLRAACREHDRAAFACREMGVPRPEKQTKQACDDRAALAWREHELRKMQEQAR